MSDVVDLLINGRAILSAKEYDVVTAYMQTPSTFSLTTGSGGSTLDLMREVPPNSLFALRVNGVVQFVGYTDGYDRIGGGATELAISGRDRMAQLLRAHIRNERSFNNATFEQLAFAAIKGAGIEEAELQTDAAAQRAAVSGTPIVAKTIKKTTVTSGPVGEQGSNPEVAIISTDPLAFGVVQVRTGVTVVSTEQQQVVDRVTGYKAEKPIKWEAGETYFGALKKDLDRAGIFLRAGVDPAGLDPNIFYLGAPDATQAPAVWLLNTRDESPPRNGVLVVPQQQRYMMTGRHSDYVVLGTAGGGKDGRKQVIGLFHDAEVASAGIVAERVIKDPQAKNTRQANFLARKACAQARRENRSFVYQIRGRHTVPSIRNPDELVIPVPDMMAWLQDDELGISGPMWIERVRHHKSLRGGTFTDLTVIDPTDLVLGADELTEAVPSRSTTKRSKRA